MTIKVEITIPKRTVDRLTQLGRDEQTERIWELAVRAGPMMEAEVVRIVKAEMFWDRPPHRRHRHTVKLVNSFVSVVDGRRGEFNVSSRLTQKRGVSAKKIAALEHGQRSHEISGSKGLAFPRDDPVETNPARQAYGKNNFWIREPVVHPGREGFHMMRRARDHTVALLTL